MQCRCPQFWQFWRSEGIASSTAEEPYTTEEAAAFPHETADRGADGGAAQADTELEEAEAFTFQSKMVNRSSTAAARPGTPTACTCTAPDTATGTPGSNPHRCHTNRDQAEPPVSTKQGQA